MLDTLACLEVRNPATQHAAISTARDVGRLNHRVPSRLADQHDIACPVDDLDLNAVVVDLFDQREQSFTSLARGDGSHLVLRWTGTKNGTTGGWPPTLTGSASPRVRQGKVVPPFQPVG